MVGVSGLIGAIRIPAAPATAALIIQLNKRDAVGGHAADVGAGLGLRHRPRQQPEPGPPVDRGQYQRQHDHGDGEVEAVRQHASTSPNSQRSAGKIASTLTGDVPSRIAISAWITTSTPSDATARASGGRLAQRPEHHQVQQRAEQRRDHQGDARRRG